MIRCFLAGLLLSIAGVWLAWLAGWINRVELTTKALPVVTALGLSFEREGMRSFVAASGTFEGVDVRVRWGTGLLGPTTAVSVGTAPWEAVPDEQAVEAWLTTRVRR
ncbi:MAG: hypothetical protein EXR71_10730 [Myxococcales bacterium]|nr:hypothetical protein [Myxococcales bacterium]